MRDLASPIGVFVREGCDVQAGYEIEVGKLYGAFKVWAENNGHTKSSKQVSAATCTPPSPRSESLSSGAPESAGASIPGSASDPSAPRRRPESRLGRSRLHGPRTMSCLLYDRVRRVHNTSRDMLNASETHSCRT